MTKISKAGREILKKWQEMGVKFLWLDQHGCFTFEYHAKDYSIPEQPVPKCALRSQLWLTDLKGLTVEYKGTPIGEVVIPSQPIPKELLEIEDPKKDILIHHPEERMLWLQQRIAGTNEVWQKLFRNSGEWIDINVEYDPTWSSDYEYRVKPKTVKYYFCVIRRKDGSIGVFGQPGTKEELESSATFGGATIIGNIEERDVEV